MKNTAICSIFAAALCAAGAFSGAELPAYRRNYVTAYPASAVTTGPVVIDGDIGEWRPDAFITTVQDPSNPDIRSCRIALAYDTKGLYVIMDVNDSSPMQNEVDPLGDPFAGWRGDAMQMRFVTPGRMMSHWTWWYYTAKDLPAVDVRYSIDFADPVTLTGAESSLKYRKRDGGYTMELLMPWKLLKADGPGQGKWQTIIEPHFNVFGKEVVAYSDCMVYEEGSMYRRANLWGELRFANEDNAGAMLSEQKAAERKRFGGEDTDMASWAVPVKFSMPADGFASLALADSAGHSVRTLLARSKKGKGEFTVYWDGLDDDGNPLPAGRYSVRTLTHQGIKPRFVTSVHNSGNPPWVTADGRGGWGADHGNPVDVEAGPDGQVYLMWSVNEAGHFLIGVDKDGRKQWGGSIPWGDLEGNATALAHSGGSVYVSKNGGLLVYDAKTGGRSSFPGKESAIPSKSWPDAGSDVAGIVSTPGSLFVSLSKPGKVLELDAKSFKVLSSWVLTNAGPIAYDTYSRHIYALADGKVWSLKPDPFAVPKPFITSGLDSPAGICADGKGDIYVSMQGKRMCVAVFDSKGKFLRTIGREGGRPYIGRYDPNGMLRPKGICVDTLGRLWVAEDDNQPKRISQWDARSGRFLREFFGGASYAVMMAPDPDNPEQVYLQNCRFIVDYEKGTSVPDATVYRGQLSYYGFMGATLQISRYMGRTFAYNANGTVLSWDRNEFKPLVEVGPNMVNNIFQFGGTFFPGASCIRGKSVFRPQGLTKEGVPVYPEPAKATPILSGNGPMTRYSNWMDVWPSLESNWKEFYAIASLPDTKLGGIPDGGGGDGIYRFKPDGEILWRYPRVKVFYAVKDQRLAGDGDLMGAVRIAGLVQMPRDKGGEIVAIGCYRGYFGLVSGDGLFIDKISDDKGKGLPPDFDTFFIENFSGYFFKHPKTGKVYLFCGDVDGRILELQGLDGIRNTDGGPVVIADADVKRMADGRAAAQSARAQDGVGPLKVARVEAPPAPDASSIPGGTMRRIALDETRTAEAGLCCDGKNLYGVFRVDDPSPWKNGSTDWKMLFKGGDAVDVQLGDKDGRALVRIFAAPGGNDGEPLIVGMWPAALKGMAPASQLYKSPVGQEIFQRVAKPDGASVSVSKGESGYTVVVAVPWASLGIDPPAAGTVMRGDLGILFSDPSGARTIRRVYIFNRETSIVDDVPSEVRLAPKSWGEVGF